MTNQLGFFDEQVKDQIKSLERQIEEIRKEIAPKLNEIRELEEKVTHLHKYLGASKKQNEKTKKEALAISKKPFFLREKAIEILKEAGKPMTISELIDEIQRQGYSIPGKDPRANFSAHLSNESRLEKVARATYTLKTTEEDENTL